jgi:hypothetical protein
LAELHPDFYNTAIQFVTLQVPEVSGALPKIVLKIPQFGSAVIDTSDTAALFRDEFNKKIAVRDPVVIKKQPVVSAGLATDACKK